MDIDETGDRWIYCPFEELKDEFHGDGISSKKTDNIMSTVTTLTHPTPRKSSPGDCNFVVTKLNPAAIVTNLGGNMARFTQFPIMITRSTIIYEIISPGAAGSSIYV